MFDGIDTLLLPQLAGEEDLSKQKFPPRTINLILGNRSPKKVRDDWVKYRDKEKARRESWRPPEPPQTEPPQQGPPQTELPFDAWALNNFLLNQPKLNKPSRPAVVIFPSLASKLVA